MPIKDDIWISAPPERVFRAFTEGDELAKWWPDQSAQTSPELGGSIQLTWNESWTVESKFESFSPPNSASFIFIDDLVTFSTKPDDGGTMLTLVHDCKESDPIDKLLYVAAAWGRLLLALKCWVEREWDVRIK